MSQDPLYCTRRRALSAVATVGGAGAAAGAGTRGRLSDVEASSGNVVRTGTLDLTLDGAEGSVEFLAATGVAPGDSGRSVLTVANAGSTDGSVRVAVGELVGYEHGLVGDENAADDTGGDPGAGNGELQNYLEVHAEFRDGPALWSGYDTVASRLHTGATYDLDYVLASGASDEFVFDWRLPADAGVDAQSDGLDLVLTFRLEQPVAGGGA